MSLFASIRVEFGRLTRSPVFWLAAALTLAAPRLGSISYATNVASSVALRALGFPVQAGTSVGALVFALLTLYESHRVHRYEMDALTDAVVSPTRMHAARVIALLLAACLIGLVILLAYLPFTWLRMGILFDLGDYLGFYMIYLMPALCMGCLIAAIGYELTRRIELGALLFLACYFVSTSMSVYDDYLLRWVNPPLPTLTDFFSNAQPLRMAAYNRVFWLLLLSGTWGLALLCTRRYGKGALGSLLRNARHIAVPIVSLALIAAGLGAYALQPFVNHSPKDVFVIPFEQPENVYLQSTHVEATPNIRLGTQRGVATFRLRNENAQAVEMRLAINCGYTVRSMTLNGEPWPFTDLRNDTFRDKHVSFELPPVAKAELVVEYGGYPQLASLLGVHMGGDEIERRYLYLTNAAFSPKLLAAPEGNTYHNTALITLPANLTPLLLSGEATLKAASGRTKTWRLENHSDAHSGSRSLNTFYLFAADYRMVDVSTSDMRAAFYYSGKHAPVMARANIVEALSDVMAYCTERFGVLPFSEDNALKLLQITSFMSGGYADGGMSVMFENAFAEEGLTDPLRGASGQEVMAHEIIHQWWGLGRMFSDQAYMEYAPDWSSEGLAVYTTYRLMKDKYGADYAEQYYVNVWQQELEKMRRDFYFRHPEYLDILPETYAARVRSRYEQVLRYCQMPLKILKAEALVGGEALMDEILRRLFNEDDALAIAPYLSYQDFLNACGLTEEELAL